MRKLLFATMVLLIHARTRCGESAPFYEPLPLRTVQDPVLVQEHRDTVVRQVEDLDRVIPSTWVKQISKMVRLHSRRDGMPAENFGVVFTKSGKLRHLLATFPIAASGIDNQFVPPYTIACAEYDKKEGKLMLSPKTTESSPYGFELFGIDDLPLICRELIPIQRLQRRFVANGLNYTLDAGVIVADGGKHWAWSISPSENQRPNIIFNMTYHPESKEVHVVPIEDQQVSHAVEQSVNEAGMSLKWDRHH